MTEKMVDVLIDAIEIAFDGRYVRPVVGFLNDDWIDFNIDIEAVWISCDKADELVDDIEDVREFCEFFNEKNIKFEEVDEAMADRERLVKVVADMIKVKSYELAFKTLNF